MEDDQNVVQQLLSRVTVLCGSPTEAARWYREVPLPSCGHRTAQQLVSSGKPEVVSAYVDHWERGGFE